MTSPASMFESLKAVVRALNNAGVEYLVVGGYAVVSHGYTRLTQDLDLVMRLERQNVITAMEALSVLGYRPSRPVDVRGLADPVLRDRWVTEKGMVVFNLVSDQHPRLPVDVFMTMPFDFNAELRTSGKGEIASGLTIPVVSLSTLIRMKEQTDRDKDRDDVAHLRFIQEAAREADPRAAGEENR